MVTTTTKTRRDIKDIQERFSEAWDEKGYKAIERDIGEGITIGDDIKITVVRISIFDNQVTLLVEDLVDKIIGLDWGESISMRDGIKVTAKSIKDQVKLGIEAPEGVTVDRWE
jgi:sRNA-binding carbon storage regulator CsrA